MDQYVNLREISALQPEDGEDEERSRLQDIMHNEQVEIDQALFNELVSICAKIKELFIPMGRPLRYPKLFSEI